MKVVAYTDFSYARGSEGVTAQLPFVLFLNALSQSAVELSVVGRLAASEDPFPFRLDPRIAFTGLPSYPSLAHPLAVARASRGTLRAFARASADADAVWLFGPHPFALAFAAIARARGQRVILGVRQDLPALIRRRRDGDRWMRLSASVLEASYRLLARRCDTVVVGGDLAVSYGAARRLLNLAISLVPESQVVDLGTALRRDYDGELTALSVGRLDPEKNPLMLADVAGCLRRHDPRWRLDVFGRGSMAEELGVRIEELGLADGVSLRGYTPVDQGLVPAYRGAHAMLHVSWTEGVPQVLFEAFAAGLPVVATDVGGVREAVGDAAILVPPGDPEAAAAGLERIGNDPVLRETLVRRGLARVADRTLERQVGRALAFISADGAPGR